MLSPDYSQAKMVPPEQMDAATDAGWAQASKMVNPDGEHKWVPNEQMENLKAKGWTPIEADGSFHIQPIEGEEFADTMKRASKAGQWLSQHPEVGKQLIQNQTVKGLREAPLVLAAAPLIGAAQPAAISGAAAAPGMAITAGIKGAKGLTAWAAANPMTAKVFYEVLKAALTGTAIGAGAKLAGKVVKAAPGE